MQNENQQKNNAPRPTANTATVAPTQTFLVQKTLQLAVLDPVGSSKPRKYVIQEVGEQRQLAQRTHDEFKQLHDWLAKKFPNELKSIQFPAQKSSIISMKGNKQKRLHAYLLALLEKQDLLLQDVTFQKFCNVSKSTNASNATILSPTTARKMVDSGESKQVAATVATGQEGIAEQVSEFVLIAAGGGVGVGNSDQEDEGEHNVAVLAPPAAATTTETKKSWLSVSVLIKVAVVACVVAIAAQQVYSKTKK